MKTDIWKGELAANHSAAAEITQLATMNHN